ncbi:hypothetical protein ACSMXN_18080 [Jatrophihabitans sp. DSM 45814]
MAGRRKTGLTPEAVAVMRGQLADGKRVRVRLADPQFGAGTTGAVTRIGDPAVDGADYVTVRVSVNGHTDELPFAPNELDLPASKAVPSKASKVTSRSTSRRRSTPKPTVKPPAGVDTPSTAAPDSRSGDSAPAKISTPTPAAAHTVDPPTEASRPVKVASRRKAGAPAKISITITSTGAAWSVSALRGAKSVAKSLAVPPGVVTAVAELLAQPSISEAVAEVNETALAETEQRAAKLRAELAELDAVLAAHRVPAG